MKTVQIDNFVSKQFIVYSRIAELKAPELSLGRVSSRFQHWIFRLSTRFFPKIRNARTKFLYDWVIGVTNNQREHRSGLLERCTVQNTTDLILGSSNFPSRVWPQKSQIKSDTFGPSRTISVSFRIWILLLGTISRPGRTEPGFRPQIKVYGSGVF